MTFYNGHQSFGRYRGALTFANLLNYVIKQIMNPVKVMEQTKKSLINAQNGLHHINVLGSFKRFTFNYIFDIL